MRASKTTVSSRGDSSGAQQLMRDATRDTLGPVRHLGPDLARTLIDAVNRRTMEDARSVAQYARNDGLSPAEAVALGHVAEEARGRPILDIGVGGGRTVRDLRAVSDDYVGLDYSRPMIDVVEQRFPGVRFVHGDARDMRFLPSASIFLAVFSCNGIGMVTHDDRLSILREVRRVLTPGGAFLFSTHNQNCPDHTAGYTFPEFEWSRNPAKLALRSLRFARRSVKRAVNRYRFARHDYRSDEYSIINDRCHDYGTMLYYISLAAQRRQLEAHGFQPGARAFDLDGREIDGDSDHSSLTLLARV